MRTVKIIAGIGCFVGPLFPGLLVLGELNFFFINLPFLICALWFGGAGCFLMVQRNVPMSRKAKILIALTVCPFATYVIAVVVPGFIRATYQTAGNACVNNLRQIEAAKYQWALEKNKKDSDVATEADITPYIKLDSKGNVPKCPAGGTCIIGRVREDPKCSIGISAWPIEHLLYPTNNWRTNFKAAYSLAFGLHHVSRGAATESSPR